jgi:transcriptional regulator with XRE-family HTH domain
VCGTGSAGGCAGADHDVSGGVKDGAKNPLGPVGQRVMVNVKQLREDRRLSYKDLSARLASLGRPIPVLGLSRLEKGERRVDADDLVALAVALGCTPNRLLLPDLGPLEDQVFEVTPGEFHKGARLWAWATGEQPLDPGGWVEEYMFVRENRPQHFGSVNVVAAGAQVRAFERLVQVLVDARTEGLTSTEVRRITELVLDDVSRRLKPEPDDEGTTRCTSADSRPACGRSQSATVPESATRTPTCSRAS